MLQSNRVHVVELKRVSRVMSTGRTLTTYTQLQGVTLCHASVLQHPSQFSPLDTAAELAEPPQIVCDLWL